MIPCRNSVSSKAWQQQEPSWRRAAVFVLLLEKTGSGRRPWRKQEAFGSLGDGRTRFVKRAERIEMDTKSYIQDTENQLVHVYNRFPIVLERGEGVYLYDANDKKYLDFGSGIGVMGLGYGNKEYTDALTDQLHKLIHTSNLYYSDVIDSAAKGLKKASGMDRVFFTNSGTEAIEGALKAAKKYAYLRDGNNSDHEIIAMNHSFHGRTMGALSVTGTEHYRTPFEKLIPGIRFADYNDIDSVRSQVTDKTCAIILETLQGEGGIYPAEPEFIAGLKQLQQEKDILLIFDEVQCGMGRTGSMFCFQQYDIQPDIITAAKAIGCGVPVGAFLMTERVADASLEPGDHGSTYGGNPLACRAVDEVLKIYEKEDICGHVKALTPYLEEKLDGLAGKYSAIKERRGRGFMQGLELDPSVPVGDVIHQAQEKGLLLLSAGSNVLRLLPPLVIEKGHIDEMAGILDEIFAKYEKA